MRIIFKDTSAKVCTEIGVMTKVNDYLLTLSSIEPKLVANIAYFFW